MFMPKRSLIKAASFLQAGIALIALGWSQGLYAESIVSLQTGNWDDIATWSSTNLPTPIDDVTILSSHTVTVHNAEQKIVNNLNIQSNAMLTHLGNSDVELYRVDLVISNDLTVAGAIDVAGKGYRSSSGPGAGTVNVGANHGGTGRSNETRMPTYGSIHAPVNWGSAAHGCPGGGAVRLRVGNTTTLDGTINANAKWMGATRYAGGAGGSVWLTTKILTGSGSISANGTHADYSHNNYAYGGGGGRISVVLSDSDSFGEVTMTAYGGWHDTLGTFWPGCGTIYFRKSGQSEGRGTLVLDNGGKSLTANMSALITDQVTEREVGDVVIRNGARFALYTDADLQVYGSWSNASAFAAVPDSTLVLAGTNAATVRGDTTFYNLNCTNGGKTVTFESGSSIGVDGLLTFSGQSGNLLKLRATEPDHWMLGAADGPLHQVSYVDVQYSEANEVPITAFDSFDGGNNIQWVFAETGATNVWEGNVDSQWSLSDNWSLGRIPVYTDQVEIPDGCPAYPVLSFSPTLLALSLSENASLGLNGNNLTVTTDLLVNGALDASREEFIRVGGDLDLTGGTFSPAQSTIVFDGASGQDVVSDGNTFFRVTIENAAATVTFSDVLRALWFDNMGGTVVTAGSALISNTLANVSGSVTFAGDAAMHLCDSDAGSMTFGGTAAMHTLVSENSALAFQSAATIQDVSAAGTGSMTFTSNETVTVENFLVLGSDAGLITLASATPGSRWNLDVTRWSSVVRVRVSDSDARSGHAINANLSVDAGNNEGWAFGDPAEWRVWNGSVSTDFSSPANWTPAETPASTNRVLVDSDHAYAPRITSEAAAAELVIGGDAPVVLTADVSVDIAGNMTVMRNATVRHTSNGATKLYAIDFTVGGDLMVAGRIDADGRGYSSNNGLGAGGIQIGANHGGTGYRNDTRKPTYGSVREPVTLGSGAHGCPGGGAIKLAVTNDTYVLAEGAVSANGKWMGGAVYGGGAGGSVWLITRSLSGEGRVSANGTHGEYDPYTGSRRYIHGGGGGRVALELTATEQADGVAVTAYGGWHETLGNFWPGCGTVYLRTPGQSETGGTMVLDNAGMPLSDGMSALVVTQVTERVVGEVVIRNGARFSLSGAVDLTVHGSWSNAAAFSSSPTGMVYFAGSDESTLYGNTTFGSLSSTTPGKTITFEAATTTTVQGLLELVSANLGSTEDGVSWSLALDETTGSQDIRAVRVGDSDASLGQTLYSMPLSQDLGNNINWVFVPPEGTILLIR